MMHSGYYDRKHGNFVEFSKLNKSGITMLGIHYAFEISDEAIAAIARPVPNLKVFCFDFIAYVMTFHAAMVMKI